MASVHEPFARREPARPARPPKSSPLQMARLIEGEIIPRLLLAHSGDPVAARPAAPELVLGAHDAKTLAQLTLSCEVFGLLGHVDRFLARGVAIESIYLDLLAPAARVLGEFWEQDVCDFVDVTMGLWRLQQVVHELGGRAVDPGVAARADRRVLFAAVPGDQHSFGLVIIEEIFRRSGWRTWSAGDAGLPELCTIVGRQWFELIGITVSTAAQVEALPAMIGAMRGASRNPSVGVMVGGQPLNDAPQLLAQTGADATAGDGRLALAVAEQLVERCSRRSGGDSA